MCLATGIAAAEAAGATLVVITAAHPQSTATRHVSLRSYETLSAEITGNGSLQLL